ncbi:glycosyl hydrolase family 65 protein [Dictyobacter kobayashii]|uniref:Glycoside hydrolase family 65 C-terminal domain-containing protein n=1 Tax=Dictyobacter kobayashii TaxID=2014872 RepID=A0A402AHQ6_9CHLR|nr:glycosyl hydrolase family 65 protein [Dictyobacter kobayashii]GCE18650.1 hypothetical protein KDK_24500 [Dictyobacter kobayashii]
MLLFGIADAEQASSVLQQQHVTAHGIPCIWPPFERYSSADGMSFGRHCGVVWPHIQAFWAQAAAEHGRLDLFEHELRNLAGKARCDNQFAEIYHPITGAIYGGLQEGCVDEAGNKQIGEWESCARQTWSATGYLRMILMGLLGMHFDGGGISFQPSVPKDLTQLILTNLTYRSMILDIEIQGSGSTIQDFLLNGQAVPARRISASNTGRQHIVIRLG